MADHWDIINIRDDKGKSTWPQKNTEEMIDRILSKISRKAQQGEYYNNPISEGTVFLNRRFDKIPSLKKFKFLVTYGDPTQSELKGKAKNKKGSRKAVWLCGMIGDVLYVIKGFIFKGSNADFINFYFVLHKWVAGRVPVYHYIENNSMQDPFFQQVFKPHVAAQRKKTGINLTITPDEERKTDKAVRIEANLEPLDRESRLIMNIDEKDEPNMDELNNEFQFFTLALDYPADGVDCVEGAKRIIENKLRELTPSTVIPAKAMRKYNRHRR